MAWQIEALVVDGCGLLDLVERGVAGDEVWCELAQLHGLLEALADETRDAEAADAARSVGAEIDLAWRRRSRPVPERLAG